MNTSRPSSCLSGTLVDAGGVFMCLAALLDKPAVAPGVWQPKYWEHTIEDEGDMERHVDDIHYNPVKHGHVRCPIDWPWSSFHRWVKYGAYPSNWGCSALSPLKFNDIEKSVGE